MSKVKGAFAKAGKAIGKAVASAGQRLVDSMTTSTDSQYKLLLIGETGSGKTSFLNLLCNCGTVQSFGAGINQEALERFRNFNDISLENAHSSKMESKTSGAKRYDMQLGNLKVGVIDTPGFGDSRGFDQDEENAEKIIEVLKKEDYINCVCLIINGRNARMSASLRYVLTEITAILPKEILKNVIVVFTNTSDPLDLNFDPVSLVEFFGKEADLVYCFVENPYCRLEKAKFQVDKIGKARVAHSLLKSFQDTAKVLGGMCAHIKKFSQVHTLHFTELYEKKQDIEIGVLELLTAYDNQCKLERSIQATRQEVIVAVREKSLNKNFTSTQRFTKSVVVRTRKHNTLCCASNCHMNCHVECNLPKSFKKKVFKRCACMGGGDKCTICGHSFELHYHDEALFKEQAIVKELVDEEMKQKFKRAKNAEAQAHIIHKELDRQREEVRKEKKRLSEELLNKIDEFKEMGVARNYAKLIENQLVVMKTRLRGTTGPDAEYLEKTKEELEKKLMLVQEAVKTRPTYTG